jgi:Glycosyl hydrolase family 71
MVFRSNARAAFAALTLMFLFSAISGCGSSSNSSNGVPTPPTASTVPTASTAPPPATSATKPAPAPAPAPAPPKTASTLVTASNSGDACLPAVMPSATALFNAPKRVFAHYLYPFPVSIDNTASADDYYNRNYLSKTGESSKWVAQGGYLRQRPLGVPVSAKTNWQQLNMESEVRAAIARGITGFTFDSMSATDATDSNSALHLMLAAAQAVDSRFKIVVMPDITALGSNSNAVVEIIATAAASPAAYRLSDGRLVVSAFDAGLNPAGWWQSVISRLTSQGIHIAFVPTFLGWAATADAFAPFSYGFADWGGATVGGASAQQGDPEIVHKTYGKIFMMPVDPQQYRPKDFAYWEAGNSAAFRDAWNSSIQGDADWIQMITWNDFSESSAISPVTDGTLQRTIGTGFYNLTGFYTAWFLAGQKPQITHDVLYYFYRREPTTAAGPAQSRKDTLSSGVADNGIELLAFLTSPGVLKITVGGKTYTQNAAAGVVSFQVPSQAGTPLFTLSRSGVDVFSFNGGVQIFGSAGLPSGIQDLTYWSGSASKSGVCAL